MNKEEVIKNISDFRKNTIKMVKEGKMTADEAYMTVDELSDAVYKINQEVEEVTAPFKGYVQTELDKAINKIPRPLLKRFEREVFIKENLTAEDIYSATELYSSRGTSSLKAPYYIEK